MRQVILKLQLIVFVILLLVAILYFSYLEKDTINVDNAITFSLDSGVYDNNINIKLKKKISLPSGTKLYYTLDGNKPTSESSLYDKSIKLEKKDNTIVYPLKVVAFHNGVYSDIYEKTYVISDKKNDVIIASLAIDKDSLYNAEYGLFTEKNLNNKSDEFMKESYISMFDTNGSVIMDQDVKVGLAGSSNVNAGIKSFKLKVSDDEDKLEFLFDEDISNTSIIKNYNTLKLRSRYGVDLRNSLINKLVKESNIDGYFSVKRCTLFLNGEFYGIHDIQQSTSNNYIAKKYGIEDKDNLVVVKSKGLIDRSGDIDILNYLGVYNLFLNNLDKEENRELLEEKVDIDNYLEYLAIELLIDNVDWPNKNVGVWYYKGDNENNYKYKDGKLRYFLYDLDYAYRDMKEAPSWMVGVDAIENIVNGDFSFSHIINTKYYRDRLIIMFQDLLNTSFSDRNLNKSINKEIDEIINTLKEYYEKDVYDNYLNDIENMRKLALNRKNEVFDTLKKYYEFGNLYQFNIECDKGIKAYWNNMEIFEDNKYSNKYYDKLEFSIKYDSYKGYDFDYWLVNGKKIYDKELKINSDLIKNNKIDIQLVSKKNKNDKLIIEEISAGGSADWMKLFNISDKTIDLSNYYLSDNKKKLDKCSLSNITLKPFSSVVINGKNNYFAIGDYICNFNLSGGEVLYLYNIKSDEIIDYVYVPRMSKIESYGRYLNSNKYVYYNNIDNKRK